MALDFRASQWAGNKLIASGSTGTGAKLLVYPISADTVATPHQGIINSDVFGTGSIGQDVFIFVSGSRRARHGSGNNIAVFGGDVHVSGNLTVEGLNGEIYVNVKSFGALGNDTQNDVTFIQAAIDYVKNSNYGGTVFFPSGTYKISGPTGIVIPRTSRPLRLLGTGPGASSLHASAGELAADTAVISFDSTPNVQTHYFQMEEIQASRSDGGKVFSYTRNSATDAERFMTPSWKNVNFVCGGKTGYNFYADGMLYAHFYNVQCRGGEVACVISNSSHVHGVDIHTLYDYTQINGILIDGGGNMVFDATRIDACSGGYGVRVTGSAHNILFNGIWFEGKLTDPHLDLKSVYDIQVNGISSGGPTVSGATGLAIGHDSSLIKVRGGYFGNFLDKGGSAIQIWSGSRDIILEDLNIWGNAESEIVFRGVSARVKGTSVGGAGAVPTEHYNITHGLTSSLYTSGTLSVREYNYYTFNYSAPGTFDTLYNGREGQIFYLVAGNSNCTIVNGGNIFITGSRWNMQTGDTLSLICDGVNWREIGRSGNYPSMTPPNTLWQSTVNDVAFTTGSAWVTGSVYGTLLSGSTGLQVTGSAQVNGSAHITGSVVVTGGGLFKTGLTGALNDLPDGSPFLVAGTNITLATGSKGQVTINGAAAAYWKSTDNDVTFTTGSAWATGSLRVLNLSSSTAGVQITGTLALTGELNVTASNLYLTDTSTGAAGPNIQIYQDSSSPIATDVLGEIKFYGNSNAGTKRKFAGIQGGINFNGDGIEYGEVNIRALNLGSEATILKLIGDGGDGGIFSNAKAAGSTPPIRFRAIANYTAGQPIIYFESNNGNTLSAQLDGDGDLTLSKDIYAFMLSGSKGCQVTGTLDVNGGLVNKITTLTGSYTALANDYILAMSASTTSSAVVTLPANPEVGRTVIVKDIRGTAGTSNVTITGSAGTLSVDGATSYIIAINYGAATVTFFGSGYWGVV